MQSCFTPDGQESQNKRYFGYRNFWKCGHGEWSWFGTNMLGVGLHSYGFMDKAFNPLMYFILSQMLFIGLAYFPDFKSKPQAEAPA